MFFFYAVVFCWTESKCDCIQFGAISTCGIMIQIVFVCLYMCKRHEHMCIRTCICIMQLLLCSHIPPVLPTPKWFICLPFEIKREQRTEEYNLLFLDERENFTSNVTSWTSASALTISAYFSSRFICLLLGSIYKLTREILYPLWSVPLTEGTGCSAAASQEA